MHELLRRSLAGLSVGDAFGERFFQPSAVLEAALRDRQVPATPPWRWTDDTAMALSVVETLEAFGHIDEVELGRRFGARYRADPARGYGRGAHEVLDLLANGVAWKQASASLFEGQGSKGNGAAMRAPPVGAFFAKAEFSKVVEEAHRSAAPTHAHPEGQAGAVAVAVCAAALARKLPLALVWTHVLANTPHGPTRDGLERASRLGFDVPVSRAVEVLGSGAKVLSEDTVPFSIWCALRHHDDFEEAMWTTVSGLGDRDTTCAIVGGLVALKDAPPEKWVKAREALPR
ncbi:MAG TPA: ADP-ribosylglycohydrolase family protein [Archangium sp.]